MPPAPGATPSSTAGGERRSILPLVSVPVPFTDGRECSRPFAAPPRSSRADGRHVGGLSPQDSHTGRVPPKLLGDKAVSGPRRPGSIGAITPESRPAANSLPRRSIATALSQPLRSIRHVCARSDKRSPDSCRSSELRWLSTLGGRRARQLAHPVLPTVPAPWSNTRRNIHILRP
jgi:hypothetical protein